MENLVVSRRQKRRALERACRAAAGQANPDVHPSDAIARYGLARAVQAQEPALAPEPLQLIAGTIVPGEKQARALVRGLRPDLTPQRVGQMVNSWSREHWWGRLPDGRNYALSNSLEARTDRQCGEAAEAHREVGALAHDKSRS